MVHVSACHTNHWQWQTPSHAGSNSEHSHDNPTTKPLHYVSNEPLLSATPALILLLCQSTPLSLSCSVNQPIEPLQGSIKRPRWCAVCGRCFGSGPTPLHHPLPHNPGTPRWHAGARDGRAGVGGGRLVRRGVVEREREASLFHALLVQWTAHVLGAD